jgi:hypothetical protein
MSSKRKHLGSAAGETPQGRANLLPTA